MLLRLLTFLCAAALEFVEAKDRGARSHEEVFPNMVSRFLSFSATFAIVHRPLLLSAAVVFLGRMLLKTGPKRPKALITAAENPTPVRRADTVTDPADTSSDADADADAEGDEGGDDGRNGIDDDYNCEAQCATNGRPPADADASAFYDRLKNFGIGVTRLKNGKEDAFELRVNDGCELVWPRRSPFSAAVAAAPNALPLSTLVAAFFCDGSDTRFILQFQRKVLFLQAASANDAKTIVDGFVALRAVFRGDMIKFMRGLRRSPSVTSIATTTSSSSSSRHRHHRSASSSSAPLARSLSFSPGAHRNDDDADAASTAPSPRHIFRQLSLSLRGSFRTRTHEYVVAERCPISRTIL